MASKFRRGAVAYTAKGSRYTVDAVEDGTVYCIAENGAETEFAENALLSEAEWLARNEKRSGNVYSRIKQSRLFTGAAGKLDRNTAATVLQRIEKLSPGILDFTAFTMASLALKEAGEPNAAASLSISKTRAAFEEVAPEIRASLLAALLNTPAQVLVNAAGLGDNLMRALIDKGVAAHAVAFDEFCDRPRS
jgi:hypothetical protein